MAERAWKTDRHDPIRELSPHLWHIEGPLPGGPLRRVMTAAKRADGDVVIHSAICLDEPSMARLEGWGKLAYLVVPNRFHRMAAPAYKARYPELCVLCPAGSRGAVEKVVAVDKTYDAFPSDAVVELRYLDGVAEREGVMVVRSDDGVTLVFNDALFNTQHLPGVSGFLLNHVTGSTGGPRVSRIFKLAAVSDKQALRRSFERLADTPDLRRLVVSHHEIIDSDPAAALREAAGRL